MKIKDLINYFETTENPKFFLEDVFSFRGVYAEVAFRTSNSGSIDRTKEILKLATSVPLYGYKGGWYSYDENTEVHFEVDSSVSTEGRVAEEYLFNKYGVKF